MARFISNERVPVYLDEDPSNIIYIRSKMNVGVQNRVQDAIAAISQDGGKADISYHLGAYNNALLTCNVLGWEGPDFDKVPCTPENILELDPDDPLLEKVLEEINRRNTKAKDSPDPKLSSANGKGGSKPKPSQGNPA